MISFECCSHWPKASSPNWTCRKATYSVLRTYTRTCELLPLHTDLADTVWGLRQDGQKDDLEKTRGTELATSGEVAVLVMRLMFKDDRYIRKRIIPGELRIHGGVTKNRFSASYLIPRLSIWPVTCDPYYTCAFITIHVSAKHQVPSLMHHLRFFLPHKNQEDK